MVVGDEVDDSQRLQADPYDALAVHCAERAKATREFVNVEDVTPKATKPA